MRIFLIPIIAFSFFTVSCLSIKTMQRTYKITMNVDQALKEKERIDAAENPAMKFKLEESLLGRLLIVRSGIVKDVLPSTDIDYKFYVLVQVESPKGLVDICIYSKDNDLMAQLERGKTKIKALGDFKRFFKLIDNTYIKIDVIDADISIIK